MLASDEALVRDRIRLMRPHKPVFETERLAAREMIPSDLDFVAEQLSDPEVMRFYPKALTLEESSGWLNRQISRYEVDGHGLWLIIERETHVAVGQVGLLTQVVDGVPEMEIGYLIHRPFWRRGYAIEAATACREIGFSRWGSKRIISLIRPVNIPSCGVARKLGMEPMGTTIRAGLEHQILSITREKYKRLSSPAGLISS